MKDVSVHVNDTKEIKENTFINSIGDTIIALVGFLVGAWILQSGLFQNTPINRLLALYIVLIFYVLFLLYDIDTVTNFF